MSENNLSERLATVVKIADDTNRTISVVNSSFTLVNNLRKLASFLTKDSNDLVPWEQSLELAKGAAPPFEQRREAKINTLLNVQSAVAQSMRSNYEQSGFSIDVNPSFLSNLSQLIPSAISAVGLLTVVDGYLTRREMRKGFEMVADKIDAGFGMVADKIDAGFEMVTETLKTGFSELDAKFDWGFSEIMWRFDQQAKIEAEIRDLLANPSATRSKELRIKGIEHYMLGEIEEARKALLVSIDEPANLADYIAEFYLGNIFLYQSNYEQAIFYYGESARHAEPRSKIHYISALMHQGFAYYIADRENKKDDFRRAMDCIKKAIDAEPHCTELKYQLAQYAALSGEISTALDHLDTIVRSDPKYVVKILAEADFINIRSQIDKMLLDYDQELSAIFSKLFNDVTSILSQLAKICDHRGLPVQIDIEKPSDLSSYAYSTTEGKVIGCDWVLRDGILHPLNTSLLTEICNESNKVLSQLEESVEIYKRGDLLSKKIAIDSLAEVSFRNLSMLPFDLKTGRLRVNYTIRYYNYGWVYWYASCYVGCGWYYKWGSRECRTWEGTKEIYVGIGDERI